MTPKALKALKGSIKKWKAIVAGTGEDWGDDNCPLCIEYFGNGCKGCPVAKATKEPCCNNTPYREEWRKLGYPSKAVTPAQNAAATKMLDFLKSLLPQAKAKSAAR